MSATNTANLKQWLEKSDIDYFTCFVKAWIPFNAWYRHNYDAIEQERQVLNEIKKDDNRIRRRFLARIDGSDSEAEELRNHIAALHSRLSNDPLEDRKGQRLSFEAVLIGQNPLHFAEHKFSHWIYRVERVSNSRDVVSTIVSSRGNVFCRIVQTNGWDIEDFETHPDYLALKNDDPARLRQSYLAANPKQYKSLLQSNEGQETIQMDGYRFTADKNALFAGLIEILYSMRNLLFHGEVVPDEVTNQTYEPAFHLLRSLMKTAV